MGDEYFFPLFDGLDPLPWIYTAEQFFEACNILDDHGKLSFAFDHLEGEALNWFLYFHHNGRVHSWEQFLDEFTYLYDLSEYRHLLGDSWHLSQKQLQNYSHQTQIQHFQNSNINFNPPSYDPSTFLSPNSSLILATNPHPEPKPLKPSLQLLSSFSSNLDTNGAAASLHLQQNANRVQIKVHDTFIFIGEFLMLGIGCIQFPKEGIGDLQIELNFVDATFKMNDEHVLSFENYNDNIELLTEIPYFRVPKQYVDVYLLKACGLQLGWKVSRYFNREPNTYKVFEEIAKKELYLNCGKLGNVQKVFEEVTNTSVVPEIDNGIGNIKFVCLQVCMQKEITEKDLILHVSGIKLVYICYGQIADLEKSELAKCGSKKEDATKEGKMLGAEETFLSCALGWCIEWLQAYFFVWDDIMGNSYTIQGQPYWFKQQKIGMVVLNDGILLQKHSGRILKKPFNQKHYFVDLLNLFNEVEFCTVSGQMIDLITTHVGEKYLSNYSLETHCRVAVCKIGYYSFYLPVACALIMACENQDNHVDVKYLLAMVIYSQVKDDYLGCFCNLYVVGKVGTNIEDFKCTWLVLKVLELGNEEQKKLSFGISKIMIQVWLKPSWPPPVLV